MTKSPQQLWDDFKTFSKVYIDINDADPMYPVLRKITDELGMDLEGKIEFCFWYMCWYNLRSALEAYLENRMRGGQPCLHIWPEQANLPIKLERRGLRGGTNIIKHWDSQLELVRRAGGWLRWVEQRFWTFDRYKCARPSAMTVGEWNWITATTTIQQVWNNGRWAAYKGCELLEKVCGLPLTAPDMGHADSSNPRKALSLLFNDLPDKDDNSRGAIAKLDIVSKELLNEATAGGVPLNKDMALLETCCCGFYSLHRGDYYLGCDIDLMLEVAMQKDDEVRELILNARRGTFPDEYLGENHGWVEHDKPRLRLYRDTGDIVVR